MEVLLLKDVPKLGLAGDTVKVADGFARNYLLPRRLATPMDEGAQRQAETLRQARAKRDQRRAEEAAALVQRLDGMSVTIKARAGEHGKLYGSVTAADIAEELARAHGVEVDKRKLALAEPIREIGEHRVEVKLAPQAAAHVLVVVEDTE